MGRMGRIALSHLQTSLTFFSLPVLFLFAHAAGMVGLRVVAFWLWQPQAHSEWCSGRIKTWTEEWNSPWTLVSPVKLSNICGFLPDQPSLKSTWNYSCTVRPSNWLSWTRKRLVDLSKWRVNQVYDALIGWSPESPPPGVLTGGTGILGFELERAVSQSPSK